MKPKWAPAPLSLPSVGTLLSPFDAMHLALAVGRQGRGRTTPNPPVGSVIVDADHRYLAAGYHAAFGGPHAEVEALKNLPPGASLENATVYVTLEPCAHHGKTPPCAETLGRLPLKAVFYGVEDPNSLVAGKGAHHLQAAGITAQTWPTLNEECEDLAEVFLTNFRQERAFVALKVATSLDGQLGLKSGASRWITGPTARTLTHHLRGQYGAVVVGVDTFLRDDPRLDIRHPAWLGHRNPVMVLDPTGRGLPQLTNSELLKAHSPDEIFWVVGQASPSMDQDLGVKRVEVPTFQDGTFDLSYLLKAAPQLGIHSLFVEGGAVTLSQFLQQKAADRLFLFMAPRLLGGSMGRCWTEELRIPELIHSPSLDRTDVEKIGDDWLVTGRLSYSH